MLCSNSGQFKKGIHPLTEFKKGQIPWNKGLTKETNEKVLKVAVLKIKQREERNCSCGCNNKFECIVTSKKRFINGHYTKQNPPIKNLQKGWLRQKERKIPLEIRYCICGCGISFECKVNSTKRFISGHNNRNLPSKRKIPIENRFCNCGCGITFECKINSIQKFISGHSTRGIKLTKEHIQKLSNSHKGQKLREIHKIDCPCSCCKAMRGEYTGENSPLWKENKSFKIYPLGWNKTFKEQIRFRDGYKCQICGVSETECKRKLCIHHINYDKMNINVDNLISLCNSCHIKTNTNREYWIEYFKIFNIRLLTILEKSEI